MVLTEPVAGVLCATGKQGRSVVEGLLDSGKFKTVRALTLTPDSSAATMLKEMGAELRHCDMNDRASIAAGLTGCTVVFGMTDSWDPELVVRPDHEFEQGYALVDVCKALNIRHLVWSSLVDAERISGGKYKVREFTEKSHVEQYIAKAGLACTTCIQPALYYQIFENFAKPKAAADGVVEFRSNLAATTKLPMFDVRDLGGVVAGIFADPKRYANAVVRVVAQELTMPDVVRIWHDVLGERARFVEITPEEMRHEGGIEMAEMYSFINEFGYFGTKDSCINRSMAGAELLGGLRTFGKFLQETCP